MTRQIVRIQTHADREATLLLDHRGVIQFANASAHWLLSNGHNELENLRVSRFLKTSPTDLKEGEWHFLQGCDEEGHPFSVEVMLEKMPPLEQTEGPFYLLSLRSPPPRREESDVHMLRFRATADLSNDSVLITDRNGVIVYVNPAFVRLTGYRVDEAIGKTPALIKSGTHSQDFYARLWQKLLNGCEFSALFVNRRKNGTLFHEQKRLRPFVGDLGEITHFISISHDVSETIQVQNRWEYLANHDSLTGLPNRSLFQDRLSQAFAQASRHNNGFALIYVDLDHLKPINDLCGHAVGDSLLRSVAEALCHCVRAEDTVARLGGDEFAMILRGVSSRKHADKILQMILSTLRSGALVGGRMMALSASMGVCLFPEDGTDEQTLMTRADKAMYRAKAAGGNGFCYFNADQDCENEAPEFIVKVKNLPSKA